MIGSPSGWLFLAAPLVLGTFLLWNFPDYRRFGWRPLATYVLIMSLLIWGALAVVAQIASARVVYSEIPLILWFTITWRLAWEIWAQYVNRIGRRTPSSPCRGWIWAGGRASLTALVFVSAFLSVVATHRCKLADGQDPLSTLDLAYESIRFPTSDGLMLDGWFVPEEPASDRTIIVCHGAGANKGNFVWFLGPLARRGYNVMFFDFRAHGGSDGRTTTYGIRERVDVIAAVDWLKRNRPEQARVVVGLGSSQGAMALALAAAEDGRINAVVLDSPFASPRELMHDNARVVPIIGPLITDLLLAEVSLQTGTNFFTASAEQAVREMGPRPVMVIHGDDDFIMPREHAQRLYAAASGPRSIWFGPGPHSNIATQAPSEYAERLFKFLEEHLGKPHKPAATRPARREPRSRSTG